MTVAEIVLTVLNLATAAMSFTAWRTARKARRATEQTMHVYDVVTPSIPEYRRQLLNEVRRSEAINRR